MSEPTRAKLEAAISAAPVTMTDSLRAAVAGGEAAKLIETAAALFEAGGKRMLSAATQRAVREVAQRGATRAIAVATGPVLESAAALAEKSLASLGAAAPALSTTARSGALLGAEAASATRQLAVGAGKQAVRAASKEILKGAGKAAGIGFVLDGAVASFEAIVAVRNGSSDKTAAIKHVAKEASTGALATGAGVLLGAGLVVLTGGIGAPVVFAVSALGSIGTKRLLRRVLR